MERGHLAQDGWREGKRWTRTGMQDVRLMTFVIGWCLSMSKAKGEKGGPPCVVWASHLGWGESVCVGYQHLWMSKSPRREGWFKLLELKERSDPYPDSSQPRRYGHMRYSVVLVDSTFVNGNWSLIVWRENDRIIELALNGKHFLLRILQQR